jgi:hypothetical protein
MSGGASAPPGHHHQDYRVTPSDGLGLLVITLQPFVLTALSLHGPVQFYVGTESVLGVGFPTQVDALRLRLIQFNKVILRDAYGYCIGLKGARMGIGIFSWISAYRAG